jgi:hypothetical protein
MEGEDATDSGEEKVLAEIVGIAGEVGEEAFEEPHLDRVGLEVEGPLRTGVVEYEVGEGEEVTGGGDEVVENGEPVQGVAAVGLERVEGNGWDEGIEVTNGGGGGGGLGEAGERSAEAVEASGGRAGEESGGAGGEFAGSEEEADCFAARGEGGGGI